jgi:hypothetical protein
MDVKRAIVWYDRKTDVCINSFPIEIGINEIKQVFIPYDWGDPLFYGSYEITPNNVIYFRKYSNLKFDFSRYCYYLEAFSEE